MKATGIVRNVDDLGRIVIPMEIRKTLGFGEREPLEISVDGDRVILQKYEQASSCVFCRSNKLVTPVKNKHVCKECLDALGGVAHE